MLRTVMLAAGLTLGTAAAAPAALADTATPTAAKYSVADTSIGTLLNDPAAKAVLVKYIPQMASSPQIDMARGMTLKQIQSFAADMLTDSVLQQIDYDLAKLPAK